VTIWSQFFEHIDFNGRSAFASLRREMPVDTYLQLPRPWFDSVSLNDAVSSVRVGVDASEQGGDLLLFQDPGYTGRFLRVQGTPGSIVGRANFFPQSFNDVCSSALLVRRYMSELPPIPLGSFGTPSLRSRIAALAAAVPGLSLRGSPIVTWDMWPSFSPSERYVYVRVPVTVDVPNWFDYDAELRVWIYMYIDASGKLQGFVDWYGCWVESGVKSGSIADRLMDGLGQRVGSIEVLVAGATGELSALTFQRVYYLPGRGGGTGDVTDDVSIVLVKQI